MRPSIRRLVHSVGGGPGLSAGSEEHKGNVGAALVTEKELTAQFYRGNEREESRMALRSQFGSVKRMLSIQKRNLSIVKGKGLAKNMKNVSSGR